MNEVGLKLSTMSDIDLCIQDDGRSWKALIEGDDHRLTKAVSRVLAQRRDGHLILPWTYTRHLLYAFQESLEMDSTSMAELIQATKVYYSTVEGFVTNDPLLLNLRRVAGYITREHDMYVFRGEGFLGRKNTGTCVGSLMNGHWEELFGKGEELLHATHDPDNYHMHIRRIIRHTSDGRQRLKSLLRPHVIKCVQGLIKVMSSSSASGCALAFVDLEQRLRDRVEWIYPHKWDYEGRSKSRSIVDEAFEEVLRDRPDLRNAVKVSCVSHSSDLPW